MKFVTAAFVFAVTAVLIDPAESARGRPREDDGGSRDRSNYEKVERYEDKKNRRKAQLERVLGDTLEKLDSHRSGDSVLNDEEHERHHKRKIMLERKLVRIENADDTDRAERQRERYRRRRSEF